MDAEMAVPAVARSASVQPASSSQTTYHPDGTKVVTTRTETASGTVVFAEETIHPGGKKEIKVTTENLYDTDSEENT